MGTISFMSSNSVLSGRHLRHKIFTIRFFFLHSLLSVCFAFLLFYKPLWCRRTNICTLTLVFFYKYFIVRIIVPNVYVNVWVWVSVFGRNGKNRSRCVCEIICILHMRQDRRGEPFLASPPPSPPIRTHILFIILYIAAHLRCVYAGCAWMYATQTISTFTRSEFETESRI